MRLNETGIRLDHNTATINLQGDTTITIQRDGFIQVRRTDGASVRYRPSRLENPSKTDDVTVKPLGERTEGEQIIKVEDNITLELRTQTEENHMRADVLFRVKEEGEVLFSGLTAEWRDGDWMVGFIKAEAFANLLEKLFNL